MKHEIIGKVRRNDIVLGAGVHSNESKVRQRSPKIPKQVIKEDEDYIADESLL
jgi:hypothetical protein